MSHYQAVSQLALDLAISDVMSAALKIRDNREVNGRHLDSASLLTNYFQKQLDEDLEVTEEIVSEDSVRRQLKEALLRIPDQRQRHPSPDDNLARQIVEHLTGMRENRLSIDQADGLVKSLVKLLKEPEEFEKVA